MGVEGIDGEATAAAGTAAATYAPGSAMNFCRQWAEQKWMRCPSCSVANGEVAGSTRMPQTGSMTVTAGCDMQAASWIPDADALSQASLIHISEPTRLLSISY